MKMSKEQFVLLFFAIIILLIGGGVFLWQNIKNNQLITSMAITDTRNLNNTVIQNQISNPSFTEGEISIQEELKEEKIIVHVAGEVFNTGVYELEKSSRVIDAVRAAGGTTSLANMDIINLASPISDGDKIYIPSVVDKINQINNSSGGNYSNYSGGSSGKININTASSSELQNLSGIGPSKADSIIDYRNKNGPFRSVDELIEVSGIGEKTLEKIRDEIVVR